MTRLEVTPVACRLVETYPNWVPHTHPAWTFRSSVSIIIIQHVLRMVRPLAQTPRTRGAAVHSPAGAAEDTHRRAEAVAQARVVVGSHLHRLPLRTS